MLVELQARHSQHSPDVPTHNYWYILAGDFPDIGAVQYSENLPPKLSLSLNLDGVQLINSESEQLSCTYSLATPGKNLPTYLPITIGIFWRVIFQIFEVTYLPITIGIFWRVIFQIFEVRYLPIIWRVIFQILDPSNIWKISRQIGGEVPTHNYWYILAGDFPDIGAFQYLENLPPNVLGPGLTYLPTTIGNKFLELETPR